MALDPGARRLLAMMAAGPRLDPATLAVADRRRGLEATMRLGGPPPAGVAASDLAVAGAAGPLAARLYVPDGAFGPGLVWFHGGGLVAGSLDTHDRLCRHLAGASRCRVLSVAYRLAPDHPFPAMFEDAACALASVLDGAPALGLDASRIAAGGDSAGGTLALAASRALAARAGPRPALVALLCPVLDARTAWPSRAAFAEGFLLDAALMARDLRDLGPADPDDPRLSPARRGDLAGLPPVVLHAAGFDPLRDEAEALAGRLRAAGVAVEHRCHEGLIHHFYGLAGAIPAAGPARDGFARAVGAGLGAA